MAVWGTKTHQNKGTRESVRLDDALDRTGLTWLQQETTPRRVQEDQVYPATQEFTKEKTRARLELESLVVPLVPPGRSQYLYNGGISSVNLTCNPIPLN